jgi:hypothetical protein
MDIESYRYLMSALIQVFGALIAVDAIFLVLRYERIRNRLDVAINRVGFHTLMIKKQGRIFGIADDEFSFQECKNEADMFVLLNSKEIYQEIQRAQDKLRQSIENWRDIFKQKLDQVQQGHARDRLARAERDLGAFQTETEEYKRCHVLLQGFPALVVKSMVIPAVLSLTFSLLLLCSESISSITFCRIQLLLAAGAFSVFLSAAGFAFVIYYARKSFR